MAFNVLNFSAKYYCADRFSLAKRSLNTKLYGILCTMFQLRNLRFNRYFNSLNIQHFARVGFSKSNLFLKC